MCVFSHLYFPIAGFIYLSLLFTLTIYIFLSLDHSLSATVPLGTSWRVRDRIPRDVSLSQGPHIAPDQNGAPGPHIKNHMFLVSWSANIFTLLSESAAKQPLNQSGKTCPGTPLVRMGEPVAARIKGCFEICLGPYDSFERSLTSPKHPLIPSQIDKMVRLDPCTKPYVLNDVLFRLSKCMVFYRGPCAPCCSWRTCCS